MLRFALSAVALVGVLAVAQPVFADPLTATASDHAQAAAPAIEQPASSSAVSASGEGKKRPRDTRPSMGGERKSMGSGW